MMGPAASFNDKKSPSVEVTKGLTSTYQLPR